MNREDLPQLLVMAALGYVAWRAVDQIKKIGEGAGGAIGRGLYDVLHPGETQAIRTGNHALKAINGTGASIYKLSTDSAWRMRLYDYSAGSFKDTTLAPPANWRDAPDLVNASNGVPGTGWVDRMRARQPWYQPWDGTGMGLRAPFTS